MAEKKKNYYAVLKGRKPGIYTEWNGMNGAEAQVKGFAGAVYRGFATLEEANYYLRTTGQVMPAPSPLLPVDEVLSAADRLPEAAPDYRADLDAGKVVIFTDGASSGNPGPGGYGVVLLYGRTRKELSGGFNCTTNNRMELTALISGLKALKSSAPVVVYSDSRYVVNAVQNGWAKRWRSRGWMRDAKSPAENADLWEQALDLLDRLEVELRWVRGHASHPENERCDQLAVQAARQKNLPRDPGFSCE